MKPEQPSEVMQQAADWVVRLRSPDRPASCERSFADWLRASPLHVREYLRAVEVWEGLAHPDAGGGRTQEDLVKAASDSNLVELPTAGAPSPPPTAHRRRFLREQRISGVFGANDPESLLDFLVKVDHIAVTRDANQTIRIGGDVPP